MKKRQTKKLHVRKIKRHSHCHRHRCRQKGGISEEAQKICQKIKNNENRNDNGSGNGDGTGSGSGNNIITIAENTVSNLGEAIGLIVSPIEQSSEEQKIKKLELENETLKQQLNKKTEVNQNTNENQNINENQNTNEIQNTNENQNTNEKSEENAVLKSQYKNINVLNEIKLNENNKLNEIKLNEITKKLDDCKTSQSYYISRRREGENLYKSLISLQNDIEEKIKKHESAKYKSDDEKSIMENVIKEAKDEIFNFKYNTEKIKYDNEKINSIKNNNFDADAKKFMQQIIPLFDNISDHSKRNMYEYIKMNQTKNEKIQIELVNFKNIDNEDKKHYNKFIQYLLYKNGLQYIYIDKIVSFSSAKFLDSIKNTVNTNTSTNNENYIESIALFLDPSTPCINLKTIEFQKTGQMNDWTDEEKIKYFLENVNENFKLKEDIKFQSLFDTMNCNDIRLYKILPIEVVALYNNIKNINLNESSKAYYDYNTYKNKVNEKFFDVVKYLNNKLDIDNLKKITVNSIIYQIEQTNKLKTFTKNYLNDVLSRLNSLKEIIKSIRENENIDNVIEIYQQDENKKLISNIMTDIPIISLLHNYKEDVININADLDEKTKNVIKNKNNQNKFLIGTIRELNNAIKNSQKYVDSISVRNVRYLKTSNEKINESINKLKPFLEVVVTDNTHLEHVVEPDATDNTPEKPVIKDSKSDKNNLFNSLFVFDTFTDIMTSVKYVLENFNKFENFVKFMKEKNKNDKYENDKEILLKNIKDEISMDQINKISISDNYVQDVDIKNILFIKKNILNIQKNIPD